MAFDSPPSYTGEIPDIPLSILESGAGFEEKMKEEGYYFESDRLYRPKEANSMIEAKNFYLLAQSIFYNLREKDVQGAADDHERMKSFHTIYAYLRQSYILVLENGEFSGLSFQDLKNLYLDVKTYDLKGSQTNKYKAEEYLDNLDLNRDSQNHVMQQASQTVYDALLSSRFSIDGFDMVIFEDVLLEYLQRSMPHMTSLKIINENGRFRLHAGSDKQFSHYDCQILFSIEDDINLIARIGEIHNQKIAEGREELHFEERIQLLEALSRLMKNLHDPHPPTNAHNARMQKLWTRFVDDPILSYAPLLHDAGKVGVNLDILGKPARPNEAEREEIEKHLNGTIMLLCNALGVKDFDLFIVMCGSHHMHYALEKASYPCYLPGDQIYECPGVIPAVLEYRSLDEAQQFIEMEVSEEDKILIRLFILIDIIEAITSGSREYKFPEEKAAAIKFIRSKAGHLFEPDVATWMIEQVRAGKLDDELIIPENDNSGEIENPVFYLGSDVLTFLEEKKGFLEDEYGLNVVADMEKLENGMNFPNMQLSSHLVRANIYSLLQSRENTLELPPEVEAEVDKLYKLFIDWMRKNDKVPKPAKPITVEAAISSANERASQILKAVS